MSIELKAKAASMWKKSEFGEFVVPEAAMRRAARCGIGVYVGICGVQGSCSPNTPPAESSGDFSVLRKALTH